MKITGKELREGHIDKVVNPYNKTVSDINVGDMVFDLASREFVKVERIWPVMGGGFDYILGEGECAFSRSRGEILTPLEYLPSMLANGPCNVTAYYIWHHLCKGEIEHAQNEYQRDGDKLGSYFKGVFKLILGCRLHLVKNCQRKWCK